MTDFFSQGILMFYITTPPDGTPSKIEGEFPRAGTAVPSPENTIATGGRPRQQCEG